MHVSHRNAQDFHKEEMWLRVKHSKTCIVSEVLCIAVAQGCIYARKNQADLQVCGNHAVYTVQFC